MPQRIVLTGFMGAGKSTLGVRLARELNWTFIDLDEEIVSFEQASIAELFRSVGETGFRERESSALAHALQRNRIVLALGGGAIENSGNRLLLTKDRETLLLYLEAPLDILLARCEQQARMQPQAALRPVLEKRAELTERFLRRKPLYEMAHWKIETGGRSPDEIVHTILTRWKEGRPERSPTATVWN